MYRNRNPQYIKKSNVNSIYKKTLNTSSKAQDIKNDASRALTVDPEIIEWFSKAKEWCDPKGPYKIVHSFNAVRIPMMVDALTNINSKDARTPLKNLKIMDAGCAGGVATEELAKLGADVTGVDACPSMIKLAEYYSSRNANSTNKAKYILENIEEHSIKTRNHYDAILASEVLEHVNHPDIFIKACVETLRPGGTFFITTPAKSVISQFYFIWLFENVVKAIPKGAHQYDKFVDYKQLKQWLEESNCKVEWSSGLWYNPCKNKWSWLKPKIMTYAVRAVKQN